MFHNQKESIHRTASEFRCILYNLEEIALGFLRPELRDEIGDNRFSIDITPRQRHEEVLDLLERGVRRQCHDVGVHFEIDDHRTIGRECLLPSGRDFGGTRHSESFQT